MIYESCRSMLRLLAKRNEILNSSDEGDNFDNSFDDNSSIDEGECVENDKDLGDSELPSIATSC